MKHQVRIEPEASAELEDAIRWYDKQHDGLGADFLGAVDATIAHVDRWPESAPPMLHVVAEVAVRRAPIQRFPYGVVYLVLDDTIRILAFAHERRKPNYWHSRTGRRREASAGSTYLQEPRKELGR